MKRDQAGRAVAVVLLDNGDTDVLCSPKAESEEQVASVQSASSERTTSVSSQEEVEEPNSDAIFQKALDDVADADNCYLIVSDYNGDGAQEAFAFTGIWNSDNENWQKLKLYYIHSDGQAEEIKNGRGWSDGRKNSDPNKPIFQIISHHTGKQNILSFEIGHPSSEYQNILLGAVGEQVTQNYLIDSRKKSMKATLQQKT